MRKLPEKNSRDTETYCVCILQFRFVDKVLLAAHYCKSSTNVQIIPRELTVIELKKMLTEKGERSSGTKETLCQR